MKRYDDLRQQLLLIEQLLRDHQQWQPGAPEASAFLSTQPFFMDTLTPHEWLQWVLLPRMHALLDGEHPLPDAFAITPYYEMALEANHHGRDALLIALTELDRMVNEGDA